MRFILPLILAVFFMGTAVFAGNPDRQGESGANELLLNPWAMSAGLHSMNTSSVYGVEAMRLNVAGLGRLSGTQFQIGNTRLYEGTGIQLNALGFGQRVGKSGAIGVSLMSVDFGDIPITTTDQPDGTGGNFSPSFINLGVGYSYTYENKISVGVLFRAVSETITDVSAVGAALDAGVQYVSGAKDNFKLGVSIRNLGTPMRYGGEGLSFETSNPDGSADYQLTVYERSQKFEMPSVLNMGVSYDYYVMSEKNYIRALVNYTSNAFSLDNIGGGLEFHVGDLLVFRGAYKYDVGSASSTVKNIYTGAAAGMSVNVPLSKNSSRRLGIDYAYRTTNPFRGTHNIGLRLNL